MLKCSNARALGCLDASMLVYFARCHTIIAKLVNRFYFLLDGIHCIPAQTCQFRMVPFIYRTNNQPVLICNIKLLFVGAVFGFCNGIPCVIHIYIIQWLQASFILPIQHIRLVRTYNNNLCINI